jgi:hypothetical protein
MGRALIMGWREPVDADRLHAPLGKLVERGGAHGAKPDYSNVIGWDGAGHGDLRSNVAASQQKACATAMLVPAPELF